MFIIKNASDRLTAAATQAAWARVSADRKAAMVATAAAKAAGVVAGLVAATLTVSSNG